MSSQARRGAVVWREIAQSARRWQTYAARAGFSAALLGVLVLGIWATTRLAASDLVDASSAPWLGRALFVAFSTIQLLLGLFLAPVLTARAVIEERVEGTLDLLVLTPLTSRALLLGKVGSRLLLVGLIVLGAMPLLALAVTLGGVSVIEVVLATLGNAVTLVVLGALGAFFGLFTRSPLLAALAAAGHALLAFLGLPGLFALLVASRTGAAQTSPFFTSLGDWSGLLLPLMWAPTVVLVFVLSGRLFELRASRAELASYFQPLVWSGRLALIGLAVLGVASVTALPLGAALCWSSHTVGSGIDLAMYAAGWLLCAVWLQLLMLLGTWLYLRVGMDLTDALETMLDGFGTERARAKRSVGHRIWRNPVAWREARVSGWGRGTVPVLAVWGLLQLAVLQSGVWVIPGGLLTVGALNAGLGVGMAVWGAVGSIEQERRGRSLDMLRLSELSSSRIIAGKLAGVAASSLPLLLFGALLIGLGVPHAAFFAVDDATEFGLLVLRGGLSGVWVVGFWLVAAHLGLVLALRMRTPGNAYLAVGALLVVWLFAPTFLLYTLPDWAVIRWPLATLTPLMAPGLALGPMLVSLVLLFGLAIALHVSAVRFVRFAGAAS